MLMNTLYDVGAELIVQKKMMSGKIDKIILYIFHSFTGIEFRSGGKMNNLLSKASAPSMLSIASSSVSP
jgi:hypothetical protein